MDIMATLPQQWRDAGDERTADLLESIASDEIQHVRFANQWIRRLAAEDKRQLFKVAHAVRFLAQVNEAFAPAPGERNAAGERMDFVGKVAPINVNDRREAEFSDEEIAAILKQAGLTALAPSGAGA
jgi:uncharacterized ferritin-like protein (DUF455 family)